MILSADEQVSFYPGGQAEAPLDEVNKTHVDETDVGYGIQVSGMDDKNENYVTSSGYGIHVTGSDDDYGIRVIGSEDVYGIGNTGSDEDYGIRVIGSEDVYGIGNTGSDVGYTGCKASEVLRSGLKQDVRLCHRSCRIVDDHMVHDEEDIDGNLYRETFGDEKTCSRFFEIV